MKAFDHGKYHLIYSSKSRPLIICIIVNDILRDAHDRVESCDCDQGCTACECHMLRDTYLTADADWCIGVVSPSCKEGNVVSSKVGALIVLKSLLARPIDVDLLEQEPNVSQTMHDTVVEATSVRVAEGVEVESA